MYDFYSMEQRMLEATRAPDARQAEVIRHLLDLEREAQTPSLRRRVASLILGLALRLDPEAPLVAPRRITLNRVLSLSKEAAHVRD